jgi:ribonuclease PH
MIAKLDSRAGRDARTHRPVEVTTGFHRLSEGSVLYKCDGTVVLVTVSVDESVPRFLEGTGRGWVTAEYQMHPRSNPKRREQRDGRSKPPSGRTREIERLVGRALRAAVNMDVLGERTLTIDCDVLEADGGTRTASITAGWIALALAADKLMTRGQLSRPLLVDQVASISVGHVQGQYLLDLNYSEDSTARVDLNLVATSKGDIIEVQGTAEGRAVPRADVDSMIDLGLEGVASLAAKQRTTLEAAGVNISRVLSS